MPVTTRRQEPEIQLLHSYEAAPAWPDLAPPETWYVHVKDVLDLGAALVMLVLAAPLILLLATLVKLTSPGPAFYSQIRLGKNGRRYRIYKLRTMSNGAERLSGPQWSKPGDSRVTWLGRFLRRSHLDELPQLWNVLKGDMSLVGPRPERPEFVDPLKKAVPFYVDRLLIRPGVTGLAQIQLPADTDVASVRRKVAYDLHYLQNASLWLDIRIFFLTAFYAAGSQIRWPFRLLGMPSPALIERAYRDRCALLTPAAAADTLPDFDLGALANNGSPASNDTLPDFDLGAQRSTASPLPRPTDSKIRFSFGV
jgi:lipopolysaccharide/colanic/teichoic acid biosynthesis glycosyltransferase